jgi:acyl-CoA thioesterase-1
MAMHRRESKLMRKSVIRITALLVVLMAALLPFGRPVFAAEGPAKLLVFGDSLVAGYGLPQGSAFPDQLGESLRADGYDVILINGGISGDTTAGGASRIVWSLSNPPDAVIVVLGGNDALRGLPADDMEANLEEILAAIQSENLPVLLAGMRAPANMGGDFGKAFDQAFLNAAQKGRQGGTPLIFYPFFLDGVALDPALNQNDGIHPNADGIAVIVERIRPSVDELLAAAGIPRE